MTRSRGINKERTMTVEYEDVLRQQYADLGVTQEAIDKYIMNHKQQEGE